MVYSQSRGLLFRRDLSLDHNSDRRPGKAPAHSVRLFEQEARKSTGPLCQVVDLGCKTHIDRFF
ncbi:MAG: hypothetical protein EA359_16900 [Balneolaceae bacterium]|nr:MAG: hypothetical protein EA359_16900 [Balneolaceae bacterium]